MCMWQLITTTQTALLSHKLGAEWIGIPFWWSCGVPPTYTMRPLNLTEWRRHCGHAWSQQQDFSLALCSVFGLPKTKRGWQPNSPPLFFCRQSSLQIPFLAICRVWPLDVPNQALLHIKFFPLFFLYLSCACKWQILINIFGFTF